MTRLCITLPPHYECSLETTKFGYVYFSIRGSADLKEFGEKLIGLGVQAIHDAREEEKRESR